MWPFTSATPAPAQHPSPEASADKCPVDHTTRQTWLANNPSTPHPFSAPAAAAAGPVAGPSSAPGQVSKPAQQIQPRLSQQRVISSIPRGSSESPNADSPGMSLREDAPSYPPSPSSSSSPAHAQPEKDASGNWIYPSEQQFFNAMLRKKHNPNPSDMRTIVPIHNAVNEKAWEEILKWEHGVDDGGRGCGGPKLVSFVGRPQERTPKALMKGLLGYTAPFDRHDWVIDRCGTHIRYVIDFYTGRAGVDQRIAFHLDVRPAVDDWIGVKTRVVGWWNGV
ncbi:cytochrome c heme-lyase [Cryptococcus wingfieldii CBS 7118]|uniref:Holocytochrome c-type synthase n=1 Tax=Cryptococcus wingfieldii CBS 7118 TaxID=1295528 RepID=A0A1E3JDS5_9TREE|nr:cytochrome c heme-lyase [Cryptococcus wingfieldii CBS 7118]ODN98256.1 cytochrome c heme-lyase [Cryptococcus wingfieldii CBS 7118]